MKILLTKEIVEDLTRDDVANGRVKDSMIPHLYLQVNVKEKKWYYEETVDGKRKRYELGKYPRMSLDDARAKAIVFDPEFDMDDDFECMTVPDMFERYLEGKASKKKSVDEVRYYYERFVKDDYDGVIASTVKTAHVEKWHRTLTRKSGPVMANRALQYLRAAFNYAIKLDILVGNPASNVDFNKERTRDRFLSKSEMNTLLSNLDCVARIHQDIIKCLLFTGQRKSQVLSMLWDDLDLDEKVWYAQVKGGKPVVVPLIDEVIDILRRRLNERKEGKKYVFYQHGPRNGHVRNLEVPWNKIRKRTGLKDVTIHDLRRTLASWQVMNGENMKVVQDTLTHGSINSTQIYARLDTETVRDSVSRTVKKMKECVEN